MEPNGNQNRTRRAVHKVTAHTHTHLINLNQFFIHLVILHRPNIKALSSRTISPSALSSFPAAGSREFAAVYERTFVCPVCTGREESEAHERNSRRREMELKLSVSGK